jgi:hypothetical protein
MEGLKKIEKIRNATYVADLCLKQPSGGWTDMPVSVFWQETPPDPSYSHYFGIFRDFRDNLIKITGAGSVTEGTWNGAMADDGEIIFSRWRHDYRMSTDGTAMVDGGRDYFKSFFSVRAVHLKLIGPSFVLHPILTSDAPCDGE